MKRKVMHVRWDKLYAIMERKEKKKHAKTTIVKDKSDVNQTTVG